MPLGRVAALKPDMSEAPPPTGRADQGWSTAEKLPQDSSPDVHVTVARGALTAPEVEAGQWFRLLGPFVRRRLVRGGRRRPENYHHERQVRPEVKRGCHGAGSLGWTRLSEYRVG